MTIAIDNINFKKNKNSWICEKFPYISISQDADNTWRLSWPVQERVESAHAINFAAALLATAKLTIRFNMKNQ